MGITPDRTPGPSFEEEIQFEDRGPLGDNDGDPVADGALRRVADAILYRAGAIVRQLLQIRNPPSGFVDLDLAGVQDGDALVYNATTLQLVPGAGGGGLTPAGHLGLDQLVHCIAETSFDQIVRTGFLVTGCITWTDALMTTKIREVAVTYNINNQPDTVTTTQYDGAGVAAETIVETVAYTALQADSITRTKTL